MTGRCRTFNARDKGGIIRKIKEGSRVSGSKSVVMLNEGNGVSVHPEKVRGILREGSYNGRIARRKPYISSTNRMKRLEFAKQYISKESEWWNNITSADECKHLW